MKQIDRFHTAIRMMDRANSRDPNREAVGGEGAPKELLYARRMTEMLDNFRPDASEELKLAARCQHIERWKIPREKYPAGRSGYLQWRNAMKKYHAGRAGDILEEAGYNREIIDRVRKLIRKEGLKTDAEAQALEDVICLVFLRWYFEDFAQKHDEEKIAGILRKTLAKMSVAGREKAREIQMSDRARKLLQEAVR